MTKHTIEITDLDDLKVEHILASSANQKHSKRLVVTINLANNSIAYEVIVDKVVDYSTSILQRAIDQYNEID